MITKFYVLAWLLLIGSTITSVYTGSFHEPALIIFGLIALGLLYALAFWAAFAGPVGTQPSRE